MRTLGSKRSQLFVLLAAGCMFYLNVPLKTRAAARQPYTVIRTESVFDDTGALRGTNRYIEARRSDGSIMRRSITPVVDQRRIDIAYGDMILTNELQRRKSTYPKFNTTMPPQANPESSCLPSPRGTVSGIDNIGGYRAVRIVYPGPDDTLTTWQAFDEGCATLQSRLDHKGAISVQTLASLIPGEPDPALFEVPAGFNEVPPSALVDPVCSSAGRCTSMPDSMKQRRDSGYYAARAK